VRCYLPGKISQPQCKANGKAPMSINQLKKFSRDERAELAQRLAALDGRDSLTYDS
jgi:hypothetical protein